jgi:peptidoglycan-associated lipoprotein
VKVKVTIASVAVLLMASLTFLGCGGLLATKRSDGPSPSRDVRTSEAPQTRGGTRDPRQTAPPQDEPGSRLSQPGTLEDLRKGTIGKETAGRSPAQDIHFDYDRYDLNEEAKKILRALSDWMVKNPQSKVEIEGHCDDRGTVEYNLALGTKRAQEAKDYLISLGVSAARLTTISYGEELPLCQEKNEECWQQNRRAHFVPVVGAKK